MDWSLQALILAIVFGPLVTCGLYALGAYIIEKKF